MAFDQEELNRRRAIRAERRKKRQLQVKLQMASAGAVLVVLVVFLALLLRGAVPGGETTPSGDQILQSGQASQPAAETAPPATEPPTVADSGPTTVIHLAVAGDLNINDTTVAAGQQASGYDYSEVFMDVAPVFSGADLALLNFEGNLVGEPYGTETVSAPQAMAEAVRAMGVDLVQVANSCAVTHGVKGLVTTLDNVRAAGLEPLGAFASAEEFQHTKGYTMVEVRGIRIALVAFTKGVGGLSLPAGSEDCVNLLYTDYATTYQSIDKEGITAILDNVSAEKPDLTVALVHWGSEYKDLVTENQKDIAALMQENGVDVILGTHSHMVHTIEYDPITGRMVAYSLGDFFGEASRAGTDYSLILDLEITRDNASGDTRVTGYDYTPIYTLTEEDTIDGQRRVVRLRETMGAYEANALGKVSESVYKDMEYALTRIIARTTPEPETEEE